jgi:AcrR family transcriptional regulator
MPSSTRTRISVEQRRQQILDATSRVTLQRGLHDVRIADVAAELDVSTGLIHYHFDTRDELLEAMLRESAAEEVAALRRALVTLDSPEARLDRFIEEYLPSARRDHSWMLWIDVWGEALRDPNIRRISEDLDGAWVEVLTEVIADGVTAGAFKCPDPVESAWRLSALLDGLGLQVVLHQGTMTRAQMRNHVRRAAALELGHDLPE